MPTSTNVTNLKINELTEAQFDSAVSGGVIGANEISIITDMDETIQVATLPTASADELDNIYQFVGTTDANYTNGYFYKCVSDGAATPTYSWSRVDVQPAGLINKATGTNSLTVLGTPATGSSSINIGKSSLAVGNFGIAIGSNAESNAAGNISIGQSAKSISGTYGIAIGKNANTSGGCVQIAFNNAYLPSNNVANTVKIANSNGNFEVMSADGSIPSDRLVHAINKYSTMPTASSTNEGWIVQFTGTTDSTYTHGHLYECVSDGQDPATYSWTEVSMGGSSLPSQTGNAGKFLTTDGTDASWGTTIKPITITPSSLYYTSVVTLKGYNNNNDILYMSMTPSTGQFEIDVRNNTGTRTGWYYFDSAFYPHTTMTTSTLGKSTNVWANVFTAKINNGADITVPTTGGTMAVIGVNTTITLAAADWSSNTQTVNVTGMTATGVVMVSPVPADQSAYTTAGIICSAQGSGTLTFTCSTTPSTAIDVNVVML